MTLHLVSIIMLLGYDYEVASALTLDTMDITSSADLLPYLGSPQ